MIDLENEDFSTPNRFRAKFGKLSSQIWEAVLLQSITDPVIDGIKFPRFPSATIQNGMHGNAGADSIREAGIFYRFIHSQPDLAACIAPEKTFLDFGCGWGRMSRPFMRDFDLANMFGYEPDIRFCSIARDVNPFICVMNGGFLPDGRIPASRFDLIVGWSVFSHLSQFSATQWLTEMSRVLATGGICVMTTWGRRFLERLLKDQKRVEAGEDVHWYSKHVIVHAGDVNQRMAEYDAGKFVWFTDRNDGGLYGDAFVPVAALQAIIAQNELPLELVLFNQTDLPQDVFALRKVPMVRKRSRD